MIEIFLFALGMIAGFTMNVLLNAEKFRNVERKEESSKVEQLIEENRYLIDQVASCKNRLENIENKTDIEHKNFKKKLEDIEFHLMEDGANFESIRIDIESLIERQEGEIVVEEFAELKQEIEYFQHIQGENSSNIRKIVKNNKENKELMCRQINNLKNCMNSKTRRKRGGRR